MVEPDNTYTRRVCAVLLADVTGFRALMGEAVSTGLAGHG
jgi:hypothetical protein